MTTGERIRARRTELGLTQEGLAVRAGVASMTVSKLERGIHRASPLVRRALAEALEVSIADLFIANGVDGEAALHLAHPPSGGATSDEPPASGEAAA